jgi:hypothetical protein
VRALRSLNQLCVKLYQQACLRITQIRGSKNKAHTHECEEQEFNSEQYIIKTHVMIYV